MTALFYALFWLIAMFLGTVVAGPFGLAAVLLGLLIATILQQLGRWFGGG